MFKKGIEVYVSDIIDFGCNIKKATLVESYVNEDYKGEKATIWVVKYEHKKGTYFNMAYEAHMTTDPTEYNLVEKRVILKERIAELEKELKDMK